MNKKTIGVLLGTLAFGTMSVSAYAEEAEAPKKAATKKGKKGGDADKKGDDKKGGEKSCGGEKGCAGGKKDDKK